jgi:hypothetical protein
MDLSFQVFTHILKTIKMCICLIISIEVSPPPTGQYQIRSSETSETDYYNLKDNNPHFNWGQNFRIVFWWRNTIQRKLQHNKVMTTMFRVVFWDILPCKMIVDRRLRGAYCLHHQRWSSLMMEAVYPRRQLWTSYSPPWELEISQWEWCNQWLN